MDVQLLAGTAAGQSSGGVRATVSPGATLRPEHAVDWLIQNYLESDGDIVLCPVGR